VASLGRQDVDYAGRITASFLMDHGSSGGHFSRTTGDLI
jgi:hypothetical protein